MTGYGQATWQRAGRALTIEVRAVNQRFLEVKFNMPREYLAWESEFRAMVQASVVRGKVDVAITRARSDAERGGVEPNLELAKAYVDAWRKIQRTLKLPGTIDIGLLQGRGQDIIRMVERRPEVTDELPAVRATLKRALDAFDRERRREGQSLVRDMSARVRELRSLRARTQKRAEELTPQFAARLRERVKTLLEGVAVSEERLLQEVAMLAERSDVTEELVRLESHLDALTGLLKGTEPAGKKLDFLLQEVHREVNTIASKSADLEVTNLTVEARAQIEKLREQAQNIE